MADINGLISDPEFIGLSTPEKKQILSEFDPEFSGISDEELQSFIGEVASIPRLKPSTQKTLSDQETLRQGIIQREQRPGLSQALEALGAPLVLGKDLVGGTFNLIKEGAQGAGTILGDTVQDTAQPVPATGQLLSDVLSKIPGLNLIPPKVMRNVQQTALEVGPRMIYELGQGGVALAQDPQKALGVVSPVSEAIRQLFEGSRTPTEQEIQKAIDDQTTLQAMAEVGEEPIVPEIIGEANIPVARSAPLVTGAPGVVRAVASGVGKAASVVSRLKGRVSPTLSQSASAVFDLAPAEAEQILANSFPILKDLRKGVPKDSRTALEISRVGRGELYDQASGYLKQAEAKDLRMKGDVAVNAVTEEISAIPTLTAEEAQAFIKPYQRYSMDINPVEGQKLLRRVNEELTSFYNKEGISEKVARANPEIAAKIAFRDSLSNQLDEMVKGVSGKDISPYRDIGGLIDFESNLAPRLGDVERTVAAQTTGIARPTPGLPVTRLGVGARAGRAALRPFVKTQVERLDKEFGRLYRESPSRIKPRSLPKQEVSGILTKYAKAPETIERSLEELIRSYPKNIRDNPSLSRAVAEAELAGQVTPLAR